MRRIALEMVELAHEAKVGHMDIFVFTDEEHRANDPYDTRGDYYDATSHAIGSSEIIGSVTSYDEEADDA